MQFLVKLEEDKDAVNNSSVSSRGCMQKHSKHKQFSKVKIKKIATWNELAV